jgi:hypothetical protein
VFQSVIAATIRLRSARPVIVILKRAVTYLAETIEEDLAENHSGKPTVSSPEQPRLSSTQNRKNRVDSLYVGVARRSRAATPCHCRYWQDTYSISSVKVQRSNTANGYLIQSARRHWMVCAEPVISGSFDSASWRPPCKTWSSTSFH